MYLQISARVLSMFKLIATWDDGEPDEEIGTYTSKEEAWNAANNHEYMSNPFCREHVDFIVIPI